MGWVTRSQRKFVASRTTRLNAGKSFEYLERRDMLAADLLQDINQLPVEDNLANQMSEVVQLDGVGYFVESSRGRGTNLFRTDGTPAGTLIVKQLDTQVRPMGFYSMVVGQQLFFTSPQDSGLALWRTDGTEAGTITLATLQTVEMVAFNDRLYFSGFDSETGIELWSSDGTVAGTGLVQDTVPGPNNGGAYNFSQLGSVLVFGANDGTSERAWSLDSSNHIELLSSQVVLESTFSKLGSVNLFLGSVNGTDSQLWRTDGTASGTIPFTDIIPGDGEVSVVSAVIGDHAIVATAPFSSQAFKLSWVDSSGNAITLLDRTSSGLVAAAPIVGSKVLLSFQNGAAPELWVVDTASVIPTVTSIEVPSLYFNSDLQNAIAWNDAWYFTAMADASVSFYADMWRVTTASPSLIKLEDGSNFDLAGSPVITSAGVYWSSISLSESEPSVVHFTDDGLTVQASSTEFLSNFAAVRNLRSLNDQIVFTGWGQDGSALRRVNADLSTTVLSPFQEPITFDSMTVDVPPADLNGRRYFFANATDGYELWRTDGTSQGTLRISNVIDPYLSASLVATSDAVYVIGTSGSDPLALWRIDDPAGNDSEAARGLTHVFDFTFSSVTAWSVGDKLFLEGYSNGDRSFLASDGTAEVSLNSLSTVSEILSPVSLNGWLYFSARDDSGNATVWRTDGTDAGTQLVSSDPVDAWFRAATDGTDLYWTTYDSPADIYHSDDGLATRTLIAQANVVELAANEGFLYYTAFMANDQMGTYRSDGSINPPELIAVNENALSLGVGLTPTPGGMLISGIVGDEFQVRLATLSHSVVIQPEMNLFSANLTSYWGSPKLGSVAIGPVFFERLRIRACLGIRGTSGEHF